jgi:transposase InsO family protein
MGWKETCAMEERIKFIQAIEKGEESLADVCRAFDVSRKTGYKWMRRYAEGGATALSDQSRAPQQQARAITADVAKAIVLARADHPRWGPKKLHVWLQRKQPAKSWPAPSTIGEILKRAGLTEKRGKRLWVAPSPLPLREVGAANDVWCVDFKGHFYCQDGRRCDPLTLTDAYSRYLLRCQVVDDLSEKYTRAWMESAFREYGLPHCIRSDNGSPFASVALSGLSTLSVWWIKLGIWPERIARGKPQQNGRHERMHRTLRECAVTPPKESLRQQQKAFHDFRKEYNEERPHEALEMKTPGEFYQASCRRYPSRIRSPEYGSGVIVRRVSSCGRMKWDGGRIFITKTLSEEPIGLQAVGDGVWKLWFGHCPIGWLDERTMQVTDLNKPPWPKNSERGNGSNCREAAD